MSQAEAVLNILKFKVTFGEASQSRYTGSVGGVQSESFFFWETQKREKKK